MLQREQEYVAYNSIEEAVLYSIIKDQAEDRTYVFGCLRIQMNLYHSSSSTSSSNNHKHNSNSNSNDGKNSKSTCTLDSAGSCDNTYEPHESKSTSLFTTDYPLRIIQRTLGWIPEDSLFEYSLWNFKIELSLLRVATNECH